MSLQECLNDLSPLIRVWLEDAINHCKNPPLPKTDIEIPRSRIFELYNYNEVRKDIELEYNKFLENQRLYVEKIIQGKYFDLLNILYRHIDKKNKKARPSFTELYYRVLLAFNMFNSWFFEYILQIIKRSFRHIP